MAAQPGWCIGQDRSAPARQRLLVPVQGLLVVAGTPDLLGRGGKPTTAPAHPPAGAWTARRLSTPSCAGAVPDRLLTAAGRWRADAPMVRAGGPPGPVRYRAAPGR